ncbi:cell division protein SepF [Actinophytocola sediminis]
MGTLQKLKAYFGMVPADEYDGYDLDDLDDGAMDYRGGYRRADYPADDEDYDTYPDDRRVPARRGHRGEMSDERFDERLDSEVNGRAEFPKRPAARPRPTWSETPVHGALAVEPNRAPSPRPRPEPAAQPSSSGYPMGRIVTLHPTSFAEARTIGEHYREGTPVIINLTEMADADAKRLVDFSAGLVFALRGAMDKVTNKVFLISPPNLDPTAEDKRRIAEGGLLNRS